MRNFGIVLLFVLPVILTLLFYGATHSCGPETCGNAETCDQGAFMLFGTGISFFGLLISWAVAIHEMMHTERHNIEIESRIQNIELKDKQMELDAVEKKLRLEADAKRNEKYETERIESKLRIEKLRQEIGLLDHKPL